MNIAIKRPYQQQRPKGPTAFAAGLCLAIAAAVLAPQAGNATVKSMRVSLADLKLSTPQGMQAARERIDQAARRLCGKLVDPWSYSHVSDYLRCVDDAKTAATTQLQGSILLASSKSRGAGVNSR
jgi:UrcA family protein